MTVRETLITRKDVRFTYFSGTGNGGQAKNKSRSAVRCLHEPSGAMGQAQDSRSKTDNERLAFKRMAETPEFQKWARLEIARRTGELLRIEEKVEYELKHNTKVEVQKDGKWVDWNEGVRDETSINSGEVNS